MGEINRIKGCATPERRPPRQFNFSRRTPLHGAAAFGHVGTAQIVIKGRAEIDGRNSNENTPLHYAALGGYVAVARLLVGAGADVNAKHDLGETPLDMGKGEPMREYLRSGVEEAAKELSNRPQEK